MNPFDLRRSVSAILGVARRAAPAAALASGLLAPAVLAASGDLDPSFGDVGRAYPMPDFVGPASAIKWQGDDGYIIGGGQYCDSFNSCDWYYYYYGKWIAGFAQRLSGSGAIDAAFAALSFGGTQVRDLAVAADGSVIGVGRWLPRTGVTDRAALTVFRLGRDGAPDEAFGENGVLHPFTDEAESVGNSVLLEPDGRIVVAGVRDGDLIVLRLLADGTLDGSFADSGIFSGPENVDYILPKVVRLADGGYRVTNQAGDCAVLALTATGSVDGSFGALGQVVVESPSICNDMTAQDDGRLLIAGRRGSGEALAARLLPSGDRDDGFDASAVADAMAEATAIEPAVGGSILVGGRGPATGLPGAIVMRLLAGGQLDTAFGHGGSTVIDLPSEFETRPGVQDFAITDGKVLVAGGDGGWSPRPFVARLMNDAAAGGPGVTGLAPYQLQVGEQDGRAVVTVRRMGGRTGPISVVLRSRPGSAVAGEDYTAIERTLTWGDGDAADQHVEIAMLADLPDAVPEEYEDFEVALSDAQGGAGLGTSVARITIAPDGAPAGQFSIWQNGSGALPESGAYAAVLVRRDFYGEGTVSVTITPVSGTATAGTDFAADPVTLTWADGELGYQNARIAILNDDAEEPAEQFSVQLSSPTGGAVVGPHSSVSFTIMRNDQPPPSAGGGGGAIGYLSLLLVAAAAFTRRCLRQAARWPGGGRAPLRQGRAAPAAAPASRVAGGRADSARQAGAWAQAAGRAMR